jgi:uncharacterized protein YbbC (DUF1343 family)
VKYKFLVFYFLSLLVVPFFNYKIFAAEKIIFIERNDIHHFYRILMNNMPEKNVCLISNQAGTGEFLFVPSNNGAQSHLHDIFNKTGHKLLKILTPEHGLSSQSESEGTETDSLLTGDLPVLPAYYKTSQELQFLFKGCEAVLFDLPDAGVRPYTYRTILTRSVQATSNMKNSPTFYLVDRPNPATIYKTTGPMVKTDFFSYLGEEEIPFFPSYTYGELLRYYIKNNQLSLNVKYIAISNYKPGVYKNGSVFNPPSPSLPHNRSLHCYWLGIFFEGTGLDYGRHTKDPFCMIGHPALDYGKKLPPISGITFSRYVYKPFSGNFQNKLLRGYKIEINDPTKFDPVKAAYELLSFFVKNYPDIKMFPEGKNMYLFDKITGSDSMRKSLLSGTSYQKWVRSESRAVNKFKSGIFNYRMY